jgi:ADP-heptose:LPS heptosyltransferase
VSKKAVISLIEHLGDIVATEPAARHLKKQGYHVTWVTLPRYKALVERNPSIDQVLTVSCLSEWAQSFPHKDYDLVADMHFDQRLCHVTRRPQTKRFGDKSVTCENHLNRGSLLGAFCAAAGLPALDDAPTLHVKPGPPALDKPYVAMHWQANEVERVWPVHRCRMLARDVTASGIPVVELGQNGVLEGVPGVVARTGSIQELAGDVAGCALFVGVDSGPAHMANALRKQALLVQGHYRVWPDYCAHTGHFKENRADIVMSFGISLGCMPIEPVRRRLFEKLHALKLV